MVTPYVPTPFSTPIINPSVGSSGAPPLPYISPSEYVFAPTAMDTNSLVPKGTAAQNQQSLADTIRRASRWADNMCFGADAAAKGASLAASLSVQSARVRLKAGMLRLVCDYRPILEVVGVDVGPNPSMLTSLDGTIASMITLGRRTIYVPCGSPYLVNRSGDSPAIVPGSYQGGFTVAIWSYVNGYPHTELAEAITEGATSCVVDSTDGNGGLWGVYSASSPFVGTQLTIYDGPATEQVYVQGVATNTPSTGQTTLTTTAFANAHALPSNVGDFIPVSAIPEDIHQAVISLATMLIKTRGARAMTMPTVAGGRPNKQALAQAGALEDFEIAHKLLHNYGVRIKAPGSY